MRLATFNILHGRSLDDGEVSIDRLHDVVARLDADVLAIQEVDVDQPRSALADLTAVAAQAMGAVSHRFVAALYGTPGATWIATVPIGYGDGIRRALTNNCDVLIAGHRYPLVGTVSMDNITVDLGPEPVARAGDVATIIGRDGGQRQTAEELARRIDTINYEVLTGISRRVPRVYHHDGKPS